MRSNESNISDKSWMKGLKENSQEVFEQVFRTMSPRLYRFALTYLMNTHAAEDIVQDVFMKLWTATSSLPDNTNINSYLYSSVKNACLNYYKHLQVEDSNKTKLTEALIYSGTLEYEDNHALFNNVQKYLQQLPEQQRRVLELKIFQGMSYKEIARELAISELSVHTHVKRAYKFIRESVPLLYVFLVVKRMI